MGSKLLCITLLLLHIVHGYGQGRVGINISTPAAMLHVKDSSVVFTGPGILNPNTGQAPASGAGHRLLWYANRAAFRTGGVDGNDWNRDSTGLYSFAAGFNTVALGLRSTALGENTRASGINAFAAGANTHASGLNAFALGSSSVASGNGALAMGTSTMATANFSMASGTLTKASGTYSVAQGSGTRAVGEASFAMGFTTRAAAAASVSGGIETIAKPFASVVFGRYNDTSSISSNIWNPVDPVFIIGNGSSNTARSNALAVHKNGGLIATGPYPLGIAGMPPASGPGSRMMWYADKSAFRAGTVVGTNWNIDSIGDYSFAAGFDTKAKGTLSVAIGYGSTATGLAASAFGSGRAWGDYSTASGQHSESAGYCGTAMGYVNYANGDFAVALGENNSAQGDAAYAFGSHNQALGNYSGAIGYDNDAIATYSICLGRQTLASGVNSLTTGRFTWSNGNYAASFGLGTRANHLACVALGTYNYIPAGSHDSWLPEDYVFVVGNGEDDDSQSNALTILKNAKTGINTPAPAAMLHVVKGIPSGGGYHASAATIVESDQTFYLQLSNDNTDECGILSGNASTSIRSGVVFRSDSTVNIRSGGNANGLIVAKNGKVGIGDVTPGFPLNFPSVLGDKISLHGTGGAHYGFGIQDFLLQIHTAGSTGDVAFGYGSSTAFTETMRIKGNGNLGVGTTNPSQKLHVVGNGLFTGTVTASCGVLTCSDIRYKKDFLPITNALSSVQSLHGIYYHWNAEAYPEQLFNSERQVGFSAQELEAIIPEVVHTDEQGFKSVDYSRLAPFLVEAIKEQQEIIDALQQSNQRQQEQIDQLMQIVLMLRGPQAQND